MPSPRAAQDAEIVLAVGNPCVRRLAEPLGGAGVVGLAVDAFGIEHGEIMHGLGVAPRGGGKIELAGVGEVLLHALALFQKARKTELRRRQALGGRALEPMRGFLQVRRHAAPFGEARADFVGGGGIAGDGGAAQMNAADFRRQLVRLRLGRRTPGWPGAQSIR